MSHPSWCFTTLRRMATARRAVSSPQFSLALSRARMLIETGCASFLRGGLSICLTAVREYECFRRNTMNATNAQMKATWRKMVGTALLWVAFSALVYVPSSGGGARGSRVNDFIADCCHPIVQRELRWLQSIFAYVRTHPLSHATILRRGSREDRHPGPHTTGHAGPGGSSATLAQQILCATKSS